MCGITGLLKELTRHGSIYESIIEMSIFLIYILLMPYSRILWRCSIIHAGRYLGCEGTQGRVALYWTRNTVWGYAKSRGREGCSAQFFFLPQKMKCLSSDFRGKFSAPRGSYQKNPISPSELKSMKSRKYQSVQVIKKFYILFFYFFLIA